MRLRISLDPTNCNIIKLVICHIIIINFSNRDFNTDKVSFVHIACSSNRPRFLTYKLNFSPMNFCMKITRISRVNLKI